MDLDFSSLNNISFTPKTPKAAPQDASALEAERRERQNVRNMYAEYQRAIREAGVLRAGIVKGAKNGADIRLLLSDAVECIGLMTGDENFKKIVLEYLEQTEYQRRGA